MIYISGANGFIGQKLLSYNPGSVSISHQALDHHHYKDFETFYYLSGYGNHSHQQDIHLTVEANVAQLERVLEKVSKLNFKNFIHVSTSSVTLDVQTPYSQTKAWAEEIVKWYAKKTGKAFISVRPYSIFGEGEADFRFMPTMVRHLVQGTEPTIDTMPAHDWVYVDDFIGALMALAEKVNAYIVPQEVGYGYATTNLQVYKDIRKILGIPGKVTYKRTKHLRSYDVARTWHKSNNDYLDEIWEPYIGYWEGLKRTVEFYKARYEKQPS